MTPRLWIGPRPGDHQKVKRALARRARAIEALIGAKSTGAQDWECQSCFADAAEHWDCSGSASGYLGCWGSAAEHCPDWPRGLAMSCSESHSVKLNQAYWRRDSSIQGWSTPAPHLGSTRTEIVDRQRRSEASWGQ